ncbi:efflux RND transporter periplasmic adaptor subunit [Alteromonas oceanisediminis]|uniref:efflux RND transporter periplasmic adaptor subunit n=1 Tax=Alteromonas oceanisediminis TaxID=2836180 RepID=UPI001BDB03C9|nr:efflux RND transporter periplasmic adaptor subunit [Alteromonas oceanisediminis]MBT0587656.1 efflux RND transporter periplasmic adaptor subunit [Alteromonas oceanisediminis]
MNTFKTLMVGCFVGAVLTASGYALLSPSTPTTSATQPEEPLYWVAPMDPNYQRDKPGKSPMGMDLVPVYAEAEKQNAEPGRIKIAPNVQQNLGVRIATARQMSLHMPIRTVGYVNYSEDTLVHIHPRVEGWVEALFVKAAGEYVEKGDPLYALYSPELVNAQQELLIAKRRDSTALIEAARARLETLQMPNDAIQLLLSTQKVQQTITFSAPQTGFVDNLNIREGFYIKPGDTLFSIGALKQVWIEAEVFESQSALVKEGLPVTISLDYLPGRTWEGKVDYIYPSLEQSTRTLRVRVRVNNEDYALKPNMFAQVTLHANVASDHVFVPSEAVIRTGTQNRVVLALGDGQFKSIEVDVGMVANDFTEISAGLRQGDKIVTSAHFLLDSESSIRSDFRRMQSDEADTHEHHADIATVSGVINTVDEHTRLVNISRDAILKWDRPAATMDFSMASTLDPKQFVVGESITFTFEVSDGEFKIIDIDAQQHEHDHEAHHDHGAHP